MRAILNEELRDSEARLTRRIAEMESSLGTVKDDMRGL